MEPNEYSGVEVPQQPLKKTTKCQDLVQNVRFKSALGGASSSGDSGPLPAEKIMEQLELEAAATVMGSKSVYESDSSESSESESSESESTESESSESESSESVTEPNDLSNLSDVLEIAFAVQPCDAASQLKGCAIATEDDSEPEKAKGAITEDDSEPEKAKGATSEPEKAKKPKAATSEPEKAKKPKSKAKAAPKPKKPKSKAKAASKSGFQKFLKEKLADSSFCPGTKHQSRWREACMAWRTSPEKVAEAGDAKGCTKCRHSLGGCGQCNPKRFKE
jgi:hypothetical protein